MSRALVHRLTRLEQQARARTRPMWPEMRAAAERLRSHAVATLQAVLHGQPPLEHDETQAPADSALVDR
jgi:hypothetical protein